MEIRVVKIFNDFYNVNEPVYEIVINDYRHLFIRESLYVKFQSGEYFLLKKGNEFYLEDKNGKVDRYNEVVY